MMLKALNDIHMNGKLITAGSEFNASKDAADTLLRLGWAEVVEEIKAPIEEEKPKKKTTKKK